MGPVPDYIKKGLNILFVGFNPSIRSGETGHHFANPNNRFWSILYQAGLTPVKLRPEDDHKLLNYGYGLTNIVQRPTKKAADISSEEYEVGRNQLREKIETYLPQIVCFVGKGVYQQYTKKRHVAWGVQNEHEVEGVTDFVAPSSSGLVRMRIDEIVEIYRALKVLIE
ncbi:TDG/mug DNA glycosylase family protein [Scopulibacillus daqui]|uniref:TDG/mug DNA glycosylase family protein n=1 Tax=Scopulibacillus daqui TaxID=1469162 RepID=A0ABS2Q112_9BACL|nr:G/U mismatch-specific DNA glycosylase [Scopulibacillus daqui]MBM7645640.1 TDG/mug DNA glycosylase family protein [Scopulibacillus daqui]